MAYKNSAYTVHLHGEIYSRGYSISCWISLYTAKDTEAVPKKEDEVFSWWDTSSQVKASKGLLMILNLWYSSAEDTKMPPLQLNKATCCHCHHHFLFRLSFVQGSILKMKEKSQTKGEFNVFPLFQLYQMYISNQMAQIIPSRACIDVFYYI